MYFPRPLCNAIFFLQQEEEIIVEKFPKSYNDGSVIKNVHMFCFLNDLKRHHSPNSWYYHNFVLTNLDNSRLFGHCLRFTMEGKTGLGALCVLSPHCYFNSKTLLGSFVVDEEWAIY